MDIGLQPDEQDRGPDEGRDSRDDVVLLTDDEPDQDQQEDQSGLPQGAWIADAGILFELFVQAG